MEFGTNLLIQQGAKLITKPSQIQKDFIQSNSKNLSINPKSNIEIKSEYLSIYQLLEKGPMYVNEIVKSQEKSIAEVNSILTMMEIEGYVEKLETNQYQRRNEQCM